MKMAATRQEESPEIRDWRLRKNRARVVATRPEESQENCERMLREDQTRKAATWQKEFQEAEGEPREVLFPASFLLEQYSLTTPQPGTDFFQGE